MGRMRVVQYVVLVGCLVGALCCSVLAPVAVASKPSTLVLHLKWREIVAGPTVVATSGSYVATSVIRCPGNAYPCSSQLTLLDQRTGVRQSLLAPSSCGSEPTPAEFGGPYLAVSCTGGSSWLYDLDSQQWVSVAPNCTGCTLQDVGSDWLKFVGIVSCSSGDHCEHGLFLQNIQTGEVKADPVLPGGRTIEDLDSPSGVVPLCSPLRYPFASSNPQGLGTLQFSGPFALSSQEPDGTRLDTLERCGSKLQLALPSYGYFGGPPNSFLSSRAVVSGFYPRGRSRPHIDGRYLPSLQKFTAPVPATKTPTYAEIVGLTQRTIYVNTTTTKQNTESLWAATLPPPPASRRH
jgi:hypothetical protein